MSEEMKIKAYGEIKKMCFEVSPGELKIKETADGVQIMMEKQKEIIKKLAEGDGEVMEVSKEIAEKLRHTMFMIQQMRFATNYIKNQALEYFKQEEFVDDKDFDEEKIYDEVEFQKFLQLVNNIAPLTHDFRNELGIFDYGPRPDSLKGNTSGKAKLVENIQYKYYGEVSRVHPQLPHGKGIMLRLANNCLDEGWFVNGTRSYRVRWVDCNWD